jgi:hypothetical protein
VYAPLLPHDAGGFTFVINIPKADADPKWVQQLSVGQHGYEVLLCHSLSVKT